MGFPHLLSLASGPVIVLLHVIWSVDKRREPLANLARYLAVGALAVIPGCGLETIALRALDDPTSAPSEAALPLLFVACVLAIGLVEEWIKLAGVRVLARSDRHLDESFDWVVYAVTTSLGFALAENVYYLAHFGGAIATTRALFAVPAHALCGTMMGYRLARAASADGEERARHRRLALWEPALWHGAYDFLAFAQSRGEDAPIPGSWFAAAFGVLVIVQWIRCTGMVRAVLLANEPLPPIVYPLRAVGLVRSRR